MQSEIVMGCVLERESYSHVRGKQEVTGKLALKYNAARKPDGEPNN
jgi:hypothetical protein